MRILKINEQPGERGEVECALTFKEIDALVVALSCCLPLDRHEIESAQHVAEMLRGILNENANNEGNCE